MTPHEAARLYHEYMATPHALGVRTFQERLTGFLHYVDFVNTPQYQDTRNDRLRRYYAFVQHMAALKAIHQAPLDGFHWNALDDLTQKIEG